jgi:hypothetical protein
MTMRVMVKRKQARIGGKGRVTVFRSLVSEVLEPRKLGAFKIEKAVMSTEVARFVIPAQAWHDDPGVAGRTSSVSLTQFSLKTVVSAQIRKSTNLP